MTTPEDVQALLNSEDFGQRLRAINLIRQLEPAIAFDLIQIAVKDQNTRVRYAAVSQLASLGQQNRELSLAILRDRLFHDNEVDVQAAAADALGALKMTEAFEDLQQIYHTSNEWLIKFSIVAALGELGDARSIGLLEEALQAEESLLKTAAIGSLGELGDERAVALLIPYASNEDWQIRYRVAQALGRFNTPTARTTLEHLAQDPIEQVASEAKTLL